MSNTNQIILSNTDTNGEGQINFKQIYALSPQYISQAISISRVFQDALVSITIDGNECLKFDFSKALDIVRKHDEMAVVGTINQTISQSSAQASVMVDKVMNLLKNVLTITLTENQKKTYEESINSAFTNLRTQSEDAWIFWQHQRSQKTTYQYNIFFAIQNEETGGVMLGLPISLTITVDLDKEQVLGITIKDKQDYSVTVQALQIVEALKN